VTRNKRPILIVIAAVLAGGAALTAFDYISTGNRHEPAAPPRAVMVAARPINARETITQAMLQTVMRPADAVDPGAFSSPAAVEGDVALGDIPAGAALTSSNVTRLSNLPSPVHLSDGMRAMSIAVDEVKDVSGLIEPGDHVDVYAITARSATEQPRAFAILRNIIVLGVGGQVAPSGATPGPQSMQWRSITLRVSALQAKTLAVADLNSTIRLALRPPGETTRSETVDTFSVPMQTGPSFPAPAAPAAAPPMPAPAAAGAAAAPQRPIQSRDGVQYILGDRVEGAGTK
jgi:pilus assembly protein CpaB